MTDQIPADKVEKIAAEMRAAMRRDEHAYPEAKFLADLSGYIKDLEALLPPRPTLADMTDEERAACRRMQADVEGRSERYVIAAPYDNDADVALIGPDWEFDWIEPDCVTPRPDLPRMKLPGTEKPAPAPALPEGWLLADHKTHGRILVTRPDPDVNGNVVIVCPAPDLITRAALTWCHRDKLTYIAGEQEGNS